MRDPHPSAPKALLRCRAVCRAWRHTTSTGDFLHTHHARQPTLPIVLAYDYGGSYSPRDIITFDHRTVDAQLQHVTQLDIEKICRLHASCDGRLLLSYDTFAASWFSISNPATRQYARLPMLCDYIVLGMYRHRPSGEYRILFYDKENELHPAAGKHDACYIFALGSVQPPRNIGGRQPEAEQVCLRGGEALVFRGNLHWHLDQRENESNMIVVFDTTTESFKQMHAPVDFRYTELFEMDGVLGMFSCNDVDTTINIWVLQDYESQVWTFKCKIQLPVNEIKLLCGNNDNSWYAAVMHGDGELLVLVQFNGWLLQVDMDGKLLANFHRNEVMTTQLRLKQSLVPHTFFPTLEY